MAAGGERRTIGVAILAIGIPDRRRVFTTLVTRIRGAEYRFVKMYKVYVESCL